MISRRLFLTVAGMLIVAPQLGAQEPRIWRIGYLTPLTPKDDAPYWQAFLEALRTLGYVDGQNIAIERRLAERIDQLPALAGELISLKADVIVVVSTPAARAAKNATSSIPIVFVGPSDPVGSGLVKSLSRPGGNVTGMTDMGIDLAGKRLQFLKQLIPRLRRVAALGYPDDPVWKPVWQELLNAARHLKIELVPVLITSPGQIENAVVNTDRRFQALYVAPQAVFYVYRQEIIKMAARCSSPVARR